ncbi:MAG: ACP S-malonyltransferase, partial [Actinomycetota bacterium]|nr:ACP S-malonyltransferase [Actinomycetota bacterium]
MYDYVITAPGQGVQRPGMLDPWLAAVPDAAARLAAWSEVAGFDLAEAGRDPSLLANTAVAQPLIVAAALLSLELLGEQLDLRASR